jgi:Tol biopolymer transport system component
VIIAGTNRTGLFQISEAGGAPVPLTALDSSRQEISHGNPAFLPDGRHFIYSRFSASRGNSGTYIGSLDAKPEQQDGKRLAGPVSGAIYAPAAEPNSEAGYLLFERERSLMAQPFDPSRLVLRGDAIAVGEDLNAGGSPSYSASATGVLVFRTGSGVEANTRLIWFDRQGKQLGQFGPPAIHNNGVYSADGNRVVVSQADLGEAGIAHIWIADQRAVFSRLNPGDTPDTAGVLSPDGRIAFTFAPAGAVGDLYWRLANGAGQAELLFKSPTVKHTNHWSLDGRFLIYDDHHPTQRQNLWIIPMGQEVRSGSERKPIPFLVTPADETFGQFSPDGKWVAYDSDESGRREVYVQGFAPDRVPAAAGGKWTISSGGGNKPRWRRDGKELFYIALDGKMMAVPVNTTSATFEPGIPIPLFETNAVGFYRYDVTPDGRFLINTATGAATPNFSPITVVLHWQARLKK